MFRGIFDEKLYPLSVLTLGLGVCCVMLLTGTRSRLTYCGFWYDTASSSRRIALVSVNPTQRHCFGSFCIHVLTKDGLPNAHATTPLDFLPFRLLESSAKQSSCGDGPAENAATSESSSLPRKSSGTTLRKDSTNYTRYRANSNPVFTSTKNNDIKQKITFQKFKKEGEGGR